MIDKSKTYRTRDGREVRIYATDGRYPFVVQGAVKTEHGEWEQINWTNGGNFMLVNGCHNDLIEVRPRHKRTVWLSVHSDRVVAWSTRKEVDCFSSKDDRIACIKVELDFEEGEGL